MVNVSAITKNLPHKPDNKRHCNKIRPIWGKKHIPNDFITHDSYTSGHSDDLLTVRRTRRKQIVYASVLTGKAKPDRMDDVIRFCRQAVLPAMKGQTGYKEIILLGNHDTHQFIVVSLWETLADLLAAEAGAYLQAQLREMRMFCVRPLTNEHYEVNYQD